MDFRFSRLIGLMPKKAKLPLDLTKPDTFPKQFLIFNMNRLIDVFDTDRIVKSGDRFEVDKSRWFNQQYIIAKPNTELAAYLRPMISERGIDVSDDYLFKKCIELMKERVEMLPDFRKAIHP